MPSFVAEPNEIKNATLGSVDSNQTVQGQMTGLLDSSNPLMQRAKTKAAQAANQRGLLNSSMGVQAGQEAMLSAALPMAQFDATQFSNQAKLNQDWGNKFGLEGNAYQYQTGLKEQDYQQQTGTGGYAPLDGAIGGGGLIASQTAAQSQLQAEKAAQELAAQAQAEQHQAGLQSSEITSRELLAGNQITHEEALAEAKNQLELDLQADRSEAAIAQIEASGIQDRAMESLRFAQDVGVPIEGFEGKDVYINPTTGELSDSPTHDGQWYDLDAYVANPTTVGAGAWGNYTGQEVAMNKLFQENFMDGILESERINDEQRALVRAQDYTQPLDQDTFYRLMAMVEIAAAEKTGRAVPDEIAKEQVDNLQVGSNGKTGRMAVQLANDLAKMEADTSNRIEMTAAEYAEKGTLSENEHDQFILQMEKEYGLQQENQEFKDRAAAYRLQLELDTKTYVADKGYDEKVLEHITSMQDLRMKEWVEINKMVFDPKDAGNDELLRQKAVDMMKAEFADLSKLSIDAITQMSDIVWNTYSTTTTNEDGTETTTYGDNITIPDDTASGNTGGLLEGVYPSTRA